MRVRLFKFHTTGAKNTTKKGQVFENFRLHFYYYFFVSLYSLRLLHETFEV